MRFGVGLGVGFGVADPVAAGFCVPVEVTLLPAGFAVVEVGLPVVVPAGVPAGVDVGVGVGNCVKGVGISGKGFDRTLATNSGRPASVLLRPLYTSVKASM